MHLSLSLLSLSLYIYILLVYCTCTCTVWYDVTYDVKPTILHNHQLLATAGTVRSHGTHTGTVNFTIVSHTMVPHIYTRILVYTTVTDL